jgi:hypothetical protein
VVQHVCTWGLASGSAWTRTVVVQVELETGASARVDADGEYQVEASYGATPRSIRGLGDRAQLAETQ